jgi:hypothetical protein
MTKKPKARSAQKPAKAKGADKAGRQSGADESRAKFERAFAKIAPPKGFAIKKT